MSEDILRLIDSIIDDAALMCDQDFMRMVLKDSYRTIYEAEQENQALKAMVEELREFIEGIAGETEMKGLYGVANMINGFLRKIPQQSLDTLKAEIADPLQYKIDELMLEYCPDEMTDEQLENWKSHQRKYQSSANENQINSKTEDK